VSVTLTPPVRVAAFVAALVVTGLAGFVFLLGGRVPGTETPTPATPATKPAPRTTAAPRATHKPAAASPRPSLAPGFPKSVQSSLRHRRVVVVAVFIPGAAVDSLVRGEARAGARMSGAAFVRISTSNEAALQKLVSKTGVLPDPAVVIVKRPGVVAATLGVTDRQTVAAAVVQAKSGR
jgi:hypothetical protein